MADPAENLAAVDRLVAAQKAAADPGPPNETGETRPGGKFIVNSVLVDAEGVPIKDEPPADANFETGKPPGGTSATPKGKDGQK